MIDKERNVRLDAVEGGKAYFFRLTTWALAQTQEKTKSAGLTELFTKLGNNDFHAWLVLASEAYNEYQEEYEKVPVAVTLKEVSKIIDAIGGLMVFIKGVSEELKGRASKKVSSPQKEGSSQ
jgi:hypothetical protein